MRMTKGFSYDARDAVWFKRLAEEARENARSNSKQLIMILKDYFERKKMLENINEGKS